MKIRFSFLLGALCTLSVFSGAQSTPSVQPTPASQPATASAPVTQAVREIRGTVKSGTTRLPGVTISAANTLTGKKVITSTDAEGNYSLILLSNGRYVVRAEFAAFAPVTKEVMINAATPTGQADLEMILLSRVPKEQNQQQNAGMGQFGSVTASGRGSQRLSVTGDQLSLSLAANSGGDAPLQGISALASTADATNESVSVNGAMGQTAAFGRGAEDMQDRIDEMRARGELPGGQSGQGNGFQGGPGGPGGRRSHHDGWPSRRWRHLPHGRPRSSEFQSTTRLSFLRRR